MTGRGNQATSKSRRSLLERASSGVLAGLLAVAVTLTGFDYSYARGEDRTLNLYHAHTRERLTITFKRNGAYDRNALRQLNHFLRDWRNNKSTNMDPQLFDIIWEVNRQVGGREPIHIVSSYRSPETNNMLRRRSSGVAKNSQHTQGKAMDFFIPGVPVSKIRAAGLRVQGGGVGFYPTSGSPFVHLDTGTVRHWPRMSRKELVSVFPRGGTLHVPSDGKPLPGYQEALASYKSRKASGNFAVASIVPEAPAPAQRAAAPVPRPRLAPGVAVAAAPNDAEVANDVISAMQQSAPPQVAAVRIDAPPMPRFAPRVTEVAALEPAAVPLPVPAPQIAAASAPAVAEPAVQAPVALAAMAEIPAALTTEVPATMASLPFGNAEDWSAPAVPRELAQALSTRNARSNNASRPIAPTAVVATVDMSRPQRAAAMTTAVLREGHRGQETPELMAFAAADQDLETVTPQRAVMTTAGVPMPVISPRRTMQASARTATRSTPPQALPQQASAATQTPSTPQFTMTALDTHSLRQWIGTVSTRQRGHALMTMPDFAQSPELMDKSVEAYSGGFTKGAPAPRTDRFTNGGVISDGSLREARVLDLTQNRMITASTR